MTALMKRIVYECPENGETVTPEFCSKCPDPCEEEIREREKNKSQNRQEGVR